MPLSRHFYALDEVAAALGRATTRNDVRETLFWCLELLESGCAAEAISTLFEAWLWQKGPFCLAWWKTARDKLGGSEISEDDVLLCAYQLSCVSWERRDASLWMVLAGSQPSRVTPRHAYTSMDSLTPLEQYLVRAVNQGRGAAAWYAAEHMEWSRVVELIPSVVDVEDYDDMLGYRSPGYDRAMKALYVLSACLCPSQREMSLAPLPTQIPAEVKATVERWKSMEGRVGRRAYSIPMDALYGKSVRGTMIWLKSTMVQLNSAEEYLEGCPFWDERMQMDRESFWRTYFPDEHPDEWTKAEKAKSHGEGVLRPGETVNMKRYTAIHLGKWSRLAWDAAPKGLENLTTPEQVMLMSSETQVNLSPLRRKRVVASCT